MLGGEGGHFHGDGLAAESADDYVDFILLLLDDVVLVEALVLFHQLQALTDVLS